MRFALPAVLFLLSGAVFANPEVADTSEAITSPLVIRSLELDAYAVDASGKACAACIKKNANGYYASCHSSNRCKIAKCLKKKSKKGPCKSKCSQAFLAKVVKAEC